MVGGVFTSEGSRIQWALVQERGPKSGCRAKPSSWAPDTSTAHSRKDQKHLPKRVAPLYETDRQLPNNRNWSHFTGHITL